MGGGSAVGLAASDVRRRIGDPKALPEAVKAVQAFTADLYKAVARSTQGNLVLSPYSVAVALAMTRNGARGRTGEEMDAVLHSPGAGLMNRAMNALTSHVEGQAGKRERLDRTKGTVALAVANSLWGQRDTPWKPAFLDALAREYGAGMHLVDYVADPGEAGRRINSWTADRTKGRIQELVPAGTLDTLTRLVLVNAVHFKAPWEEPFESAARTRPFHLSGGRTADVEMMSQDLSSADYLEGDGWVAARLPYVGGGVGLALVVPDDLATFEDGLDGAGLAALLAGLRPLGEPLEVTMPRWDFRSQVSLEAVLDTLGMKSAFDPATADFSGMTSEERLHVSHVLHQAMVAVDEEGTEAAAATAVIMGVTGARLEPAVSVVADRPFLFVIHDVETSTPLFIGRVTDPRA